MKIMNWRSGQLLVIVAVIAGIASEAVFAGTAVATHLSPYTTEIAPQEFKATSTSVGFSSEGGEEWVSCKLLTIAGSMPKAGATLTTTPQFTSCFNYYGDEAATVTTKGTWQFVANYGPPTTLAMSIPAEGFVFTFHTPIWGDCQATLTSAYNGVGDAWTNGFNSPLVNSESTLRDKGMVVKWSTWERGPNGPCERLAGKSEKIKLVTSEAPASKPLIWTDPRHPTTNTILITP